MSGRGGRGGGRGGKPSGCRSSTPATIKAFLDRSQQESGGRYGGKKGNERNRIIEEEIRNPPFYPDLLWHSNGTIRTAAATGNPNGTSENGTVVKSEEGATGTSTAQQSPTKISVVKRTQSVKFLILNGRTIHRRMQNSLYYMRPSTSSSISKKPPRIVEEMKTKVLRHISPRSLSMYIPDELLSFGKEKTSPARTAKTTSIIAEDDEDEDILTRQASTGTSSNIKEEPSAEGLDGSAATKKTSGGGDTNENEDEEDADALGDDLDDNNDDDVDDDDDYGVDHYASEEESLGGGDAEPTF